MKLLPKVECKQVAVDGTSMLSPIVGLVKTGWKVEAQIRLNHGVCFLLVKRRRWWERWGVLVASRASEAVYRS